MRKKFGQVIVDIAEKDDKVILITGDVEQEMVLFKQKFSDRFFNLGLCEQSIISLSAGLASEGFKPFVYSITPFILERPFEQIKIDIDENNLPVVLIGYDNYPKHGPTHRCLNARKTIELFKNILGCFPSSPKEVEEFMWYAYKYAPSFIHLT